MDKKVTIDRRPYFDLGKYTKAITTSSEKTQYWFNQGLNWCFGFNQEEGVKCFRKALETDPGCAMAHWGVAYAAGPFYNFPWSDFSDREEKECAHLCFNHVNIAKTSSSTITDIEAKLIDALAMRFQKNHPVAQEAFDQWDDDYADAMREVYLAYPGDMDVAALFAEAMMTRTPWKLWDTVNNRPASDADTLEVIEVLETAIDRAKRQGLIQHPAILHLYIHALEMSPAPEKALEAADILGTLCPDAGHMNHMPGHIYVLCGLYQESKTASEKAILADRMYLDYAGPYNFYTTARCHNLHLMMYTCMSMGQYGPALEAADEMCQTLTPDVLDYQGRPQMSITMEGYYSMRVHVFIRFGKWREIVDLEFPQDRKLYCVSAAMYRYAKAVAYATLGEFSEADLQRSQFYQAVAEIAEERKFFNNTAHSILSIAEAMMEGEIAYHRGNYDSAFLHLRDSVSRNDSLFYSEPWAWMHPPRHALGALLLEQGYCEEAEEVYRTDLGLNNQLQRCAQHPDNVWALHGIVECLSRKERGPEFYELSEKLNIALANTDVIIQASCCCRTAKESGAND